MRTLLALVLSLSLVGCKGEGKEPAPEKKGPPPISETEAMRGKEACRDYREKICAAAEEDPSLEETCELAESSVEAVEMQLDALKEGGDAEQRAVVQSNIRKVYKRCLEGLAELETR